MSFHIKYVDFCKINLIRLSKKIDNKQTDRSKSMNGHGYSNNAKFIFSQIYKSVANLCVFLANYKLVQRLPYKRA